MTVSASRPRLVVAFVLAITAVLSWAALGASQTVTIQDFSFAPANVTVNAGDSVTWRNTGGEAHTATSNNPGFDTGVLNPGASKTIVFGTAGISDYRCAIHLSMRGTVTVLAAVVTTPQPTPPPTAPPPPTVAPTLPPTAPPTAAPTAAVAPTSTAPAASTVAAASATPSAGAKVTPSSAPTAIAAASPSTTPAPTPLLAGDPGPLALVVGIVVVAGIAGLAYYGLRRR